MNIHILAASLAACALVVSAAQAAPSNRIVIVPPADLPALAREDGEAMLLHEAGDGRTMLYIEQDQGSRLASFDVTDPAHVKDAGSVPLSAPGAFDFVSSLGAHTELIRFRGDQTSATLNFGRGKTPNLEVLSGLKLPGPVTPLGANGFMVASSGAPDASVRDYRIVDTSSAANLRQSIDVKQVREELTNSATGTTFLLTQSGLYVVRRPDAESDRKQRAQEWFEQHTGG